MLVEDAGKLTLLKLGRIQCNDVQISQMLQSTRSANVINPELFVSPKVEHIDLYEIIVKFKGIFLKMSL